MTAGTMRLLGGEVSPFAARARLALELRGVAYELLDEPLGPKKSDRLLAANPVYGKIPVLLLPDGRAICESAVIVQYVEDVARGSGGAEAGGLLLPDDPYERAMHRFWTVFIDDKVSTPTTEQRAHLLSGLFSPATGGGACVLSFDSNMQLLWLNFCSFGRRWTPSRWRRPRTHARRPW